MDCPMVYPQCCQSVTVYRQQGDVIFRRVAENCYYRYGDEEKHTPEGIRSVRKFLLIQPGAEEIRPGDRIYEGVGPEVTAQEWDGFLPCSVPGLSVAAYANPWHWEGQICHIEAGRK